VYQLEWAPANASAVNGENVGIEEDGRKNQALWKPRAEAKTMHCLTRGMMITSPWHQGLSLRLDSMDENRRMRDSLTQNHTRCHLQKRYPASQNQRLGDDDRVCSRG
jgi:hypothetical protein